VITIDQVQSYSNERSVAISIKATKLTARLIAKAMKAYRERAKTGKHGMQSIKSLSKSGASLENVEIPGDSDINLFKKVARKYNIDFALTKDDSTDPPNHVIFFKSKDAKSMDLAFKEFSQSVLSDKAPKPSMDAELERFKDIAKGLTPDVPVIDPKDKGDFVL